MMKSIQLTSLFALLLCLATLNAQERYYDEIFSDVSVTSGVQYGTNISILPIILQESTDPQPVDLFMDVYEPMDDTMAQRPVVILAHRGDFLPPIVNQSPYGSRTDSAVVEMCTQLARRGFVAVSMDYRLGWNPFGNDIEIKKTVLEASYRISQDMRNAVRFLRWDAGMNGNTFAIDSTKMAVGGFDAAGFASQSVAHLKTVEQTLLPKFLDFSTIPPTPFVAEELLSNPYGTTNRPLNIANYPDHSSDVNVVIDFEGGLGDFSWIEAGDPPVISFQARNKFNNPGIRDVTIGVGGSIIIAEGAFPDTIVYQAQQLGNQDIFINANFDDELSQMALERNGGIEGLFLYSPVTMEGSVQCDETAGVPAVNYGGNTYAWNWYNEEVFAFIWDMVPGQTVPSDIFICQYNTSEGNPNDPAISRMMIDTLQEFMVPRLVIAMGLDMSTDVDNISKEEVGFKAFPNPTSGLLNLRAEEAIQAIQLFDLSGKLVFERSRLNHHNLQIRTNYFAPGLYFAKVQFEQGVITEKISVQ